jgi:hypothetical protein
MRKILVILFSIAVLALAGIFFLRRGKEPVPAPVPAPVSYDSTPASQSAEPEPGIETESESAPAETVSPDVASLPAEVNLKVPFTSQAPHQNWDMPYQEFCEEASMLMAASYVKGEVISGPDDADKKLLAVKAFEEKKFGSYKDTTVEETAAVLKEYFKLTKVEIVADPTEQKLKQVLAEGKVAIVPAAGRELGNPNFRRPGPIFHMLVVKGYTKTGNFITNDPGTRKGADYTYKPSVLLNAVHDWNGGDVNNGKKAAIIVG